MNLLCPDCQKMLQVPEQYAGQLMKCPLCTGTFTVPALPTPPAPPPVQMQAAPPPTPPAPVQTAPPDKLSMMPAGPSSAPAAGPPPAGYTHTRSYALNPRVLTWLPAISLLLVFALTFFTWVGMYPSGIPVLTQSAWGVAFNSQSTDEVFRSKMKKAMETSDDKEAEFLTKDGPGEVGIWTMLFILLLLVAVPVAVGGALVHLKMVPVNLPPNTQPLLVYRPLLVAGLSLALLAFAGLSMLSGFPIENKVRGAAEKIAKKMDPTKDPSTNEERQVRKMIEGGWEGAANLQRTFWYDLALFFLVVALVFALLEFFVVRRGNAPAPRIDFHY